jgi:hypothetical protein
MPPVPEIRVRIANPADVHPGGEYVLYWMIAALGAGAPGLRVIRYMSSESARRKLKVYAYVERKDSSFPLALGCVTLEGTARMGAWLRG